MPLADISSTIVLVQPWGIFAREVLRFPENAKYRQFGIAEDALTVEGRQALNKINLGSRKINASIPLHLALSFNSSPKDVSKGFVFGSDPETCDVLLGMDNYTGISGNHFSIGIDWATGSPLITCLTPSEGSTGIRIKSDSLWELYLRNAWKVLDPGSTATVKIFEDMQFVVYSPDRSQDSTYSDNLQSYFKKCQNAVPEMTHLKLYDPEPTPLLVSRGRGLTGMEYFTTSTFVGEKMVLCEAKSHQNLLGDLETFIVKRFRSVSDEWPNHAKTGLSKLRNLRHRNIIAPEDIITVMMEYMPVYLPEPPETLADRHAKFPVTEIDAPQILAQVFEGLTCLHTNGIIHGSLYPGCIRIKCSDPWLISLSDIGLYSYVDLEDPQERGYYASQPTPGISEPTKHDTWSAGVVGLNLILPGGLPPRPKQSPYDQSAWAAFMAARAKSFHASRPIGKQEASLFLTRVLKHDYRERLTAEECLQDPWIRIWHLPITDSLDPSDPFFYIPDYDSLLETIDEVENDQESGKDTDTEDQGTVTSKGKQPQRSRDMKVMPSSNLHHQGNATPKSIGRPGVIPTNARDTRVTRSKSSNKQRSPYPPTKPRPRTIKPSDSISRQNSATPSDSTIRVERNPESGRSRDQPRKSMQDHPALDHPTMLNSFQGTDEVRKQETLSKQEKLSIYMQSHPPEFKIFPVQKGFYAPESSETSRNHGLKGKRFPGYE